MRHRKKRTRAAYLFSWACVTSSPGRSPFPGAVHFRLHFPWVLFVCRLNNRQHTSLYEQFLEQQIRLSVIAAI